MDVPTSLLCVVLVIGSAAVLFIISKLGMRSMSYEEVVAENRRLAAQRGLLDDVQRTKKAQQQQTKKNKKAGKKVKEKQAKEQQAATSNSEIDSDGPVDSGPEEETPSHSKHAHVEFVESVVVDSEAAPPKPAKGKKRGKEPKVKPILLNKDDPSCISDVSVPPSPTTTEPANHFEQIHPKDEFELLHSNDKESAPKEKKESKPGKHGKGKSGGKQNLEKPTEPEIVPAPEPEPVPQEPPKEQRKVKAKQPAPVAEKVSEKWTETAVTYSSAPSQPSNLTTDKLLKKAYPLEAAVPAPNSVTIPGSDAVVTNGPSAPPKGKKKKGDPMHQLTMGGDGLNVNMLVRVLSTTPLSRSEIQILTDCLLNKQNGPLPEHSEWSEGPKDPVQKLKRQLAEKEKALTDEQEASQAVHAKLKELRASLNAERSRCTQLTANADMAANNLRLEVSSLQTRIQRSTEETNVLRQQVLLLQNKLSAEAEFTAQRSQLELHIQALSENKVSLTADLGSLQAEIADLRAEYNKATNELHISHDQNLAAQRNATEIARQLEEAKRINADLEVQKLNIKQELLVANDRLKTFNETRAELQHLMSLNSRSQQLSMQHEKQQEELDRQNQQLQTELNRIKSERDVLTTVVMEMKEELASRPTPNGTTTPEKDDSEVVEKAVAAACRELEAKHSQQIALLQGQLDQHRDKNNELRTKNWKVMEALQAAEKKVQQIDSSSMAPDVRSIRDAVTAAEAAEQRASKEVLQRLFPSVNVKAPSHREWLQQFSAQAGTLLATPPPAAPSHDLEKQNAELQARIDTYQRIINDTEGILSRLQNNVSQEEQRWKKQLMEKQTELDNLKKNSLSKLEDKIESLQKTLENEHEIRVDLEKRLSEAERLKTGGACFAEIEGRLQDSTLSLNGPSQDGFAEK